MWPGPIADRKAAWLAFTFQPAAPFTICCVLWKPGRVKGFGKGLISDRMMNTWCVVILEHDACTSRSHRRRGLSGWYALNCCPLLCPLHGDMALAIHHSLMLLWFTRWLCQSVPGFIYSELNKPGAHLAGYRETNLSWNYILCFHLTYCSKPILWWRKA